MHTVNFSKSRLSESLNTRCCAILMSLLVFATTSTCEVVAQGTDSAAPVNIPAASSPAGDSGLQPLQPSQQTVTTAGSPLTTASVPKWEDVFPHDAELVHCQAEPTDAKEQSLRASIENSVRDAQKLADRKQFAAAFAKIEVTAALPDKSPYETFIIADIEAPIQVNLQDYTGAAQSMESALATCLIAPDSVAARMRSLAVVYYQGRNYPKSIQWASAYVALTPDAEMQILVGQAYYMLGNYNYAAAAGKLAVATARTNGIAVKESWLKLVMSSEYKQGNLAEAQAALEQLNVKFPNPTYAQALAGLKANQGH